MVSYIPTFPLQLWGKKWGKYMKLNVRKIRELKEPGRYADGGSLYLHIRPGGSRQWIVRTTISGKRSDIGLGSLNYVSLAEAREKAREIVKETRAGVDPLLEKRKAKAVPTFATVSEAVWNQLKPTWKSAKHANQWISTLEDFAYPHLANKKISDISSSHILDVLTPIWTDKPETAKRIRQRLRAIFDWAKASGYYLNENPVDAVKMALPRQKESGNHHKALQWDKLPAFMQELQQRSGISASALQFLILTAGRSGEVRYAVWNEISDDLWSIPAERMKMGKLHRVPIVRQSRQILQNMSGHSETYIFPSQNSSQKPMSDMVFKALFKRMGYDEITAHGFRSTFRDWASDNNVEAREVAEAVLAHQLGDQTERAYARSDMFERRKKLMAKWADFAMSECD